MIVILLFYRQLLSVDWQPNNVVAMRRKNRSVGYQHRWCWTPSNGIERDSSNQSWEPELWTFYGAHLLYTFVAYICLSLFVYLFVFKKSSPESRDVEVPGYYRGVARDDGWMQELSVVLIRSWHVTPKRLTVINNVVGWLWANMKLIVIVLVAVF